MDIVYWILCIGVAPVAVAAMSPGGIDNTIILVEDGVSKRQRRLYGVLGWRRLLILTKPRVRTGTYRNYMIVDYHY